MRDGRRSEFKHFAAFQDPERRAKIPDPNAVATFQASIPEFGPAPWMEGILAFRASHIVPGIPGSRSAGVLVLGPKALTASWQMSNGKMLQLWMNLDEAAVAAGSVPSGGDWVEGRAIEASRLPGHSSFALVSDA